MKRLQADFIIMAGFTKTSRTTICRLCILDLLTKRRQSHTGRTDERHPPVPVFESSKILDWSTQARRLSSPFVLTIVPKPNIEFVTQVIREPLVQ